MFFWSFGQRNIGLSIQKKVANDQKWSKVKIISNFQIGAELDQNVYLALANILIFLNILSSVGSVLCGCAIT